MKPGRSLSLHASGFIQPREKERPLFGRNQIRRNVMNITTKLILAGVAACGIAMATPAEAAVHHSGHYYGHGHYWHGRWYGPGWYGPTVFVGSPYYWSGWGPGVPVVVGGGYWYHGHHYYGHRYHGRYHR